MKINLLSDLHLEFCPMPTLPGGETLFLAGDIMTAAFTDKKRTDRQSTLRRKWFKDFLDEASEKWQKIYYVSGNHESYHGDITLTHKRLRDFVSKWPNVTYMENDCVPLTDNTMLFGATMWTDMKHRDPLVMERANRGMNDFAGMISNGRTHVPYGVAQKWTADCSVTEHEATLNCISAALQEHPDKNFVVMTHHTPSYMSIHPKYGNDPLNYAFSSDLSNLILDNPRIKVWVHGHTHDTFKYSIGDCRIFCNPRGYTNNPNVIPENRSFDINFNFEVE